MTPDRELLRQFVDERADQALAELVRRHVDLVFSAALRQVGGDAHFARDVVQQVFIDLARKAAGLKHRATLEGWLYTSAHYAATNLVRAERRRRHYEQEAVTMAEPVSTTPPADWEQLRPILDQAMHELGEPDREAVLLRYFARKPLAEIGERLGLSENAATKRIERALDKLHALLAKRGITSTASALGAALANQAVVAAPVNLAPGITSLTLASVETTASTAASILQFMSTTKVMIGAATLVSLLAIGTAGYQIQLHRDAEASLAANSRDYDAMLAKLRSLQQSASAAEQDAITRSRTAATAAVVKPAEPWDGIAEGKALFARHPELGVLVKDYDNAKFDFQYAPLYESLRLTPDQIGEFRSLMSRRARERWALPLNRKVYAVPRDELSDAEVAVRLRALLGEEGYRQIDEQAPLRNARSLAVRLASALSFSEEPLSPAQANQFVQIATTNRDRSGPAGVNWDAIVEQAQPVLSAPQLRALGNLRSLLAAKASAAGTTTSAQTKTVPVP